MYKQKMKNKIFFFTGESPSLMKWSWNSSSASSGYDSCNGGGGYNNMKKLLKVCVMYRIK